MKINVFKKVGMVMFVATVFVSTVFISPKKTDAAINIGASTLNVRVQPSYFGLSDRTEKIAEICVSRKNSFKDVGTFSFSSKGWTKRAETPIAVSLRAGVRKITLPVVVTVKFVSGQTKSFEDTLFYESNPSLNKSLYFAMEGVGELFILNDGLR
ncbi:hypothetical protein RyT2_04920 [Pseudolactococcus yaeyamensis]